MHSVHTPPPQEVELTVDKPEDVLRLLRRLAAKRSLITVHAPGGAPVVLSAVLDVDAETATMMIDASTNAAANTKALLYPELRCMGQIDSIGVRFTLRGLRQCMHEGMPAFLAPLPDTVLHLQRREFYRLRLPVSKAGWCRIPIESDPAQPTDTAPETVAFRIVDISAGGVALRIPPEYVGGFTPATVFDACTLVLTGTEPLGVDMTIRHLAERRYEEGPGIWQAGCEFIQPRHTVQQHIQRFIMQAEREIAARAKGRG